MIESKFDYDDGFLYVSVHSDTTEEGMYFNFSLAMKKPFSLPVVLNASDTSFSTSFDTICSVEFNADIDLFINTAVALSGKPSQAVQVRVNTFTFEVSSLPDDEISSDYCFNTETDSVYYSHSESSGNISFFLQWQTV
jgi:hypothetical protein